MGCRRGCFRRSCPGRGRSTRAAGPARHCPPTRARVPRGSTNATESGMAGCGPGPFAPGEDDGNGRRVRERAVDQRGVRVVARGRWRGDPTAWPAAMATSHSSVLVTSVVATGRAESGHGSGVGRRGPGDAMPTSPGRARKRRGGNAAGTRARTPEPCASGLFSGPEPQLLVRVRSRRGSRRSQWRCSAAGLKASVSDMVKPWMVPG